MKMRCVSRCQLAGRCYKVDEIVEFDDKVAKENVRVKACFTPYTPVAGSDEGKIVVAGLTRLQAILKLRSALHPVDEGWTDVELKNAFEAAFDASKRGARRTK